MDKFQSAFIIWCLSVTHGVFAFNDDTVVKSNKQAEVNNEFRNHGNLKPVLCKTVVEKIDIDCPTTTATSTNLNNSNGPNCVQLNFTPTVVFVAGVEGSGHHGLVPILNNHPKINFLETVETWLHDFWDPTVPRRRRVELRDLIVSEIHREFNACINRPGVVIEDVCSYWTLTGNITMLSYPYDSPRGALRHPDLIELIDMIEGFSDPPTHQNTSTLRVTPYRFQVRILALHRTPFSTVRSALRRHFVTTKICAREVKRGKKVNWDGACDAMIYLARETEMSLTVLNAELASLSPSYVRVLNFTTMITQPSKYSQLISSFLNFGATAATQLQTAMVDKFLGPVSHSKKSNHLPETDEYLHSLFTERKSVRWNLLRSGMYDIERMQGFGHEFELADLGLVCLES